MDFPIECLNCDSTTKPFSVYVKNDNYLIYCKSCDPSNYKYLAESSDTINKLMIDCSIDIPCVCSTTSNRVSVYKTADGVITIFCDLCDPTGFSKDITNFVNDHICYRNTTSI